MFLEKKEEKMLEGEYGSGVELAMNALVKMGDAVGAERFIPIQSSHIGNAGLFNNFEGYVDIVERLVEKGAKTKVPTSENPYPYDSRTPIELAECKESSMLKETEPLTTYYRELEVIPTWTCTPYFNGNIPRYGHHISWEESSAVAYVNAVLGAKTNRESVLMDLLTAISGRTLYHGLHIDENRKGELLFSIDKKKLNSSDYPAIGYYIGKIIETEIPVIKGIPRDVSKGNLKNFGAAAASTGALAHYHIPKVTPEANSTNDAFGNEKPSEKIEIEEREIKETKEEMSYLREGEDIEMIALGCPHYSFEEVKKIAKLIEGRKIKENVKFWIFTHDGARSLAESLGYSEIIESAGGRLLAGCPHHILETPPYDEMPFMTDSGKMCYYTKSAYGGQKDCLKSGIEGKVARVKKW
ncbi:hypothetical protein AKJ62_02675 [candidate division MSBL1 archaeon SCGC-AAA259D14]|uniref:Phosphomevalonate dehydratase large subunit n=1 Tax=candidate division MSBL1 archaeon SCGC-AAA259D14 TaxID=1698261 RepID=A0A133U611_9EURY|nr:hypothetical protein AKJ62_02675 [candidate division MSBL1 archaeon SCGC-AAA259D14]